MQAGDPAVVQALHPIAQRLGDQRRLFGDRQVGGAGRGDHDQAEGIEGLGTNDQQPRERVIDVGQSRRGHRGGDVAARAGGEHVRVSRGQPLDDRHHLLRRLARTEHRLGGSAPQRPVMIDLREAQILVRQAAQPVQRRLDVDSPGAQVFEQPADGVPIHWPA